MLGHAAHCCVCGGDQISLLFTCVPQAEAAPINEALKRVCDVEDNVGFIDLELLMEKAEHKEEVCGTHSPPPTSFPYRCGTHSPPPTLLCVQGDALHLSERGYAQLRTAIYSFVSGWQARELARGGSGLGEMKPAGARLRENGEVASGVGGAKRTRAGGGRETGGRRRHS